MNKLLTLLLSITLASQLLATTLELKPEASVLRSELRVVDIISGGSNISDKVLAASLGTSPIFGQERIVTRSVIENALKGQHIQWKGAEQCKVTRPCKEIFPEEFRAQIEDELKKITNDEGSVKVFEISDNKLFFVPQGDVEVQVSLSASALNTPWTSVSVRYRIHGETLLLKTIRFRWAWERGVWIANKNLQQGDSIHPEDFTYTTQDVLRTFGQAYVGELENLDMTLTRSMQPGTLLNKQSMKPRTLVQRGSAVVVNYRNNAIEISMKGTALEDGGLGEMVAVRNNTSKKKILARVINEGTLEYAN